MSFKNKNIVRGFPFFSHFACLPLIEQSYRNYLLKTQQLVEQKLTKYGFNVEETVRRHSHLLGHLTLFMATLRGQATKNTLKQVLESSKEYIKSKLNNLRIYPSQIKYFTRQNKNQKCQQLTVIYLQIDQNANQVLVGLVDHLVRALLKHQILVAQQLKPMRIVYNHKSGRFEPQTFHISLFRCKNLMERENLLKVFEEVNAQCFGTKKLLPQNFTQANSQISEGQKIQLIQKKQMNFECKLLDVSTMMAFDATQFYQPLTRMVLSENEQKSSSKIQFQKVQKEEIKQVSIQEKQAIISG